MDQKVRWSEEAPDPADEVWPRAPVEKFFLRSRRLAAAAMPLLVAIGAACGLDPAQWSDLLAQLGEDADRFVVAALSLWGGGVALWSFLRPDHARLRAVPQVRPPSLPPGTGVGLAGGAAMALILVLAFACATPAGPRGLYAQAEQRWTDVTEAYNAVLARDQTFVEACKETAADPAACEPALAPETRARALDVIDRGGRLLDELAVLVERPEPGTARIDAILRELEHLVLELAIRETQR